MNPTTRFPWHISLTGFAVAAAIAIGATLAWADSAPTQPAAPAPTAAPASANHEAAVAAIAKARDLYEKKQYAEAQVETDKALKLEPQLKEALLLKGILNRKLADGSTNGNGGTTSNSQTTAGPKKPHLLTPSEIALIKVNEWQPKADADVRGTVDRKTLEAFWTDVMAKKNGAITPSREAHDAFVAQTNFSNQVKEIQDNGDPKYMEKVKFTSDPHSLAVFKRTIEPYVLNNCAKCHTDDKGGNFRIYKPANAGNEQVLYTNFYILAMYANADGKMIDRDHDSSSLLLQYGLRRDKAAKPHPGKVDVRFFTDANDPRFDTMVKWIYNLKIPRPNYGIVYELPGSNTPAAPAAPSDTTAPATKPAK